MNPISPAASQRVPRSEPAIGKNPRSKRRSAREASEAARNVERAIVVELPLARPNESAKRPGANAAGIVTRDTNNRRKEGRKFQRGAKGGIKNRAPPTKRGTNLATMLSGSI